jgi:GNAT superfamily N-acetyltransferase
MEYVPVDEPALDIKTKSIFCFVIAPEMKRKGIATRLLERVCQDSASDGFSYIEAYPNKTFTSDTDFTAPLDMYIKSGFTVYHQNEQKLVVRKSLR